MKIRVIYSNMDLQQGLDLRRKRLFWYSNNIFVISLTSNELTILKSIYTNDHLDCFFVLFKKIFLVISVSSLVMSRLPFITLFSFSGRLIAFNRPHCVIQKALFCNPFHLVDVPPQELNLLYILYCFASRLYKT